MRLYSVEKPSLFHFFIVHMPVSPTKFSTPSAQNIGLIHLVQCLTQEVLDKLHSSPSLTTNCMALGTLFSFLSISLCKMGIILIPSPFIWY